MEDFEKVRTWCLQRKKLWEDPDFPAVQTSAFYHQVPPFTFTWKRAKEIYSNPKFIIDNQEAFDVVPGNFGDKWLVSCMAVLYMNKGLLNRVVPTNQQFDESYCGIFRFRLWWCGRWVDVLVDDRLPTLNGKLMFVQSSSSAQLWSALLEKAYAKLHGSYEALKYGNLLNGLADFTGGITEMILIEKVNPHLLNTALGNSSIITAHLTSHFVDQVPLQPEMNYMITSVDEVLTFAGPTVLVRLRRPLAAGETDITSVVLTESQLRFIRPQERERITTPNEGFWIPFEDFVKLFDKLEMVHLDAEISLAENSLENRQRWWMEVYHGAWRKGVSAGGCRNYACEQLDLYHTNPQIQIQLDEADTVVISMTQHNITEPKVIGFSIYKISKPLTECATAQVFQTSKKSDNSNYSNSRQVTHRWALEAGVYLIIPTTFEPREEGKFSVRVFSLRYLKMNALDMQAKMKKPAVIKAPHNIDVSTFSHYETFFGQLADEQKSIDIFELQDLLEECLPNDYIRSCASIDTCRQIVLTMDKKGNGRVTISDFKDLMCSLKLWQQVFKGQAQEKMGVLRAERLRDALRELGFTLPEKAMVLIMIRYMRKDGMLRFGDFVSVVMHLHRIFENYKQSNSDEATSETRSTLSEWLVKALSC